MLNLYISSYVFWHQAGIFLCYFCSFLPSLNKDCASCRSRFVLFWRSIIFKQLSGRTVLKLFLEWFNFEICTICVNWSHQCSKVSLFSFYHLITVVLQIWSLHIFLTLNHQRALGYVLRLSQTKQESWTRHHPWIDIWP